MVCPKCNSSEMWDNRGTEKTPKSPQYKCKDTDCGHAIWLKPKGGLAKGATSNPAGRAPKWTWGTLSRTYERSLLLATKHVQAMAERYKIAFTTQDILAACATIFIAASRDGVAPIRSPEQPLEERPVALEEPEFEEDTVPF